jgi:tRNA(fMet)-specific endonuclease VapC
VTSYLLDTNIASHVVRGDRPEVSRRLASIPTAEIGISAVSEGELRYGLARRNHPPVLSERVRQFLLRVDVLPWDQEVAGVYGALRASCEAKGAVLSPLDMMIAAHAVTSNTVLVTRDRSFMLVGAPLKIEDWTS